MSWIRWFGLLSAAALCSRTTTAQTPTTQPPAPTWPVPVEGDYVAHDFRFGTG
jgi:hypothetical protein